MRTMVEGGLKRMENFEALAVLKERIMEEHWVYSFSTYLWSWGVETVGEGSEDKWEEEE